MAVSAPRTISRMVWVSPSTVREGGDQTVPGAIGVAGLESVDPGVEDHGIGVGGGVIEGGQVLEKRGLVRAVRAWGIFKQIARQPEEILEAVIVF